MKQLMLQILTALLDGNMQIQQEDGRLQPAQQLQYTETMGFIFQLQQQGAL